MAPVIVKEESLGSNTNTAQPTPPVFCHQKVWICGQSLSVKCLSSLCVASVEEEGAKVGEQLRVSHRVHRLLVNLCVIFSDNSLHF